MECEIGWEVHPSGQPRPHKPRLLTVPVKMGRQTVTALLDTGSSVSLIRAQLFPQTEPIIRFTEVAGVYRQVHRWPVVHLTLEYNGSQYSFDMMKVDDLPFPVLLGRDAPAFAELLRAALQPRAHAIDSDDKKPGPSTREPTADNYEETESDVDAVSWEMDERFQDAQETDLTLTKVREEIAVDEKQVIDPRRAYPKIREGRWVVMEGN